MLEIINNKVFELVKLLYQVENHTNTAGMDCFKIEEFEHQFLIDVEKSGPFKVISQNKDTTTLDVSLCITIVYRHIIAAFSTARIQIINNDIRFFPTEKEVNITLNLLESILLKKKLEKC